MFHLSFIIVTLSNIVSSLPSRAACVCAHTYMRLNVRRWPMCVCVITVQLYSLKKKRKEKKAGYAQPKQAKYFLNYSHNMYFFFSTSNGYLYALCLNERNKYKKVYMRSHTQKERPTWIHSNRYTHTEISSCKRIHWHPKSPSQPTNQTNGLIQWYHAVRLKQQ